MVSQLPVGWLYNNTTIFLIPQVHILRLINANRWPVLQSSAASKWSRAVGTFIAFSQQLWGGSWFALRKKLWLQVAGSACVRCCFFSPYYPPRLMHKIKQTTAQVSHCLAKGLYLTNHTTGNALPSIFLSVYIVVDVVTSLLSASHSYCVCVCIYIYKYTFVL